MPELSKAYSPGEIEQSIYQRWEKSGYFNPDKLPGAKKRKPFVISMPPPNITGDLHIGHMFGFTVQDILIRYHRMRGEAALWVPGTDHAAIATQMVVDRALRAEGLDRRQMGRAKFLQRVWQWKEQYGQKIIEQTRRMGASADWSRAHFTMDKDLTLAVNTAFKAMYDDGLIYRGERIVNWCPICQTAISDLEVDHQETPGHLWYIRYPLVDGSGFVTVATTRPETMLGDTAVAVNPLDERYRALVGKRLRLPLVNREIPIIADERIDQVFGTGAVKVTPAHDPLDFELGLKHKLPQIKIIGLDGLMTAAAGHDFVTLPVAAARQLVLDKLRTGGLLEKEEDYIHAIATCSRSKNVVEPLISLQWFVNAKLLAKLAIKAVRSGKIKIVPRRFEKTYYQWLANIRDWNISRQIWWGHRLPVWYKNGAKGQTIKVSAKSPGAGWVQDEDTLDTWFSSGLWTFSTLGWPKKTTDLKRFHPTAVMVTGWDILFFWVARMVMFSEYLLKDVPFKTVYLHGLILDEAGKKMSKSKGTGVDPIPMGEKYGMDALRISLIIGNAPGQDFRLYEKKIEGYRNFANKLWNVARFVLAQPITSQKIIADTLADRWILSRLNNLVISTTKQLDQFDLSSAGQGLYDFIWHDFADWYIESSKISPNPAIARQVLETILQLLHPFMPFITEELWAYLKPAGLLMVADWPKPNKRFSSPADEREFIKIQVTVTALRNFRVHAALPSGASGQFVGHHNDKLLSRLSGISIRRADRLMVVGQYRNILLGHMHFQFGAEFIERFESWCNQERAALDKYIVSVKQKLANENFVAHAPAEVVDQERTKLAAAEERRLSL